MQAIYIARIKVKLFSWRHYFLVAEEGCPMDGWVDMVGRVKWTGKGWMDEEGMD